MRTRERLYVRYLWRNLVNGSDDIELLSAVTLLAVGVFWLIEPPGTGGILYRVITLASPRVILPIFILIGGLHVVALLRSARPNVSWRWVAIRKVCSIPGVALWGATVIELGRFGQWLTVIVFGTIVLLLFGALARRDYT